MPPAVLPKFILVFIEPEIVSKAGTTTVLLRSLLWSLSLTLLVCKMEISVFLLGLGCTELMSMRHPAKYLPCSKHGNYRPYNHDNYVTTTVASMGSNNITEITMSLVYSSCAFILGPRLRAQRLKKYQIRMTSWWRGFLKMWQ